MPRCGNQKLKLLYLKQFFEEKTDENHPATMADIKAYLQTYGLEAERKSISSDMDALADFGMDVRIKDEEDAESRSTAYQLKKRLFTLPEVKLIIDCVASSKLLPEKTSDTLIDKLGKLVSEHQRKELRRQVRVMGRARSINNAVFDNVARINAAIDKKKAITFKYYRYNLNMDREYSHNGKLYEVSPCALLYDNNNYYLLAFVDNAFRNYRVDRMANVKVSSHPLADNEQLTKKDIAAYTKSTFGMFNGREERVEMVFHNKMIDAVVDKFGRNVWLTKEDDEHFKIAATVTVSPQFFAWIFGLEDYVTITGPDNVVKQMKDMLRKVSKRY